MCMREYTMSMLKYLNRKTAVCVLRNTE